MAMNTMKYNRLTSLRLKGLSRHQSPVSSVDRPEATSAAFIILRERNGPSGTKRR